MGKKMSAILDRNEREYLNRVIKYPNQVQMFHKDSVQEGFEYFQYQGQIKNNSRYISVIINKILAVGLKNFPKMIKIFIKNMPTITRGKKECFTDTNEYLDEFEKTEKLTRSESPLIKNYPNEELWRELTDYAWDKWKVIIGCTELPNQLIFKGKAVLFKFALVCIQEMDREQINKAPKLSAGEEVIGVYASLGLAVNDIARWLRNKYGIRCQSNHPLGGLVDTSPLAAKAGMGWQGHNGLLITPQYGQLQRIAPIFVEDKIFQFTDNHEHLWIEDFCKKCRKCEKACPTQAIYSEKQPAIENVPGIYQTRTCIDRLKCYPQFNKTLGCSICIKVCPFSQGDKNYYKIKKALKNKLKDEEKLEAKKIV